MRTCASLAPETNPAAAASCRENASIASSCLDLAGWRTFSYHSPPVFLRTRESLMPWSRTNCLIGALLLATAGCASSPFGLTTGLKPTPEPRPEPADAG